MAFVGTEIQAEWTHRRDLPTTIDALVAAATARADISRKTIERAITAHDADPSPRHSTAIVIVDKDGNIAAGMHTINALPFGDGIFVGGVPLSSALTFDVVPPGEDVLEPVSPFIVLHDGLPRLALAQFGVGEFPADFTVLTAVLDAKLPLVDAVTGPRMGYFDIGADVGTMHSETLLPITVDPRYGYDALCMLASRGWPIHAEADVHRAHVGYVDAISFSRNAGSVVLQGVPAELLEGVALTE